MIDLYTFNTPNGRKVSILLEELGVPYTAHRVSIMDGDQFKPEFLAISPNNKIPAIIDRNADGGVPVSVFESGAILIYLAEKYGKFLPTNPAGRAATLQWLMWQMGGLGPMTGQLGYFHKFAKEDVPHAKERYLNEVKRLFGVLNKQLETTGAYVTGDDYTIADIAIVPWVMALDFYGLADMIEEQPAIKRYVDQIGERPAVKAGWTVV